MPKNIQAPKRPTIIEGPIADAAQRLMEYIARRYGITVEGLRARDRHAEYVIPRHFAIYYLTQHVGLTDAQVGRLLNRNHSSVLHARKSVADQRDTDERFRARLAYLTASLKAESLIP